MSCSSISGELLAGPIVQTIFAFRIRSLSLVIRYSLFVESESSNATVVMSHWSSEK